MLPSKFRAVASILVFALTTLIVTAPVANSKQQSKTIPTSKHGFAVYSLTLETTVKMALERNREIINARRNLQNQHYFSDLARSEFDMRIHPAISYNVSSEKESDNNLGVGLTFTKKYSTGATFSVSPTLEGTSGEYTGGIGVDISQPIFRGAGSLKNKDAILSSRYALSAEERNYYKLREQIVLEAIAAFYDLARREDLLHISESLVARFSGHVMTTMAKENAGYATPIDVFRAKISQKNAEDSRVSEQEALENAKDRLKTVLALPQSVDIKVEKSYDISFEPPAMAEAIDIALRNRVEISQVTEDVTENERMVEIARHNLLPDLSLSFNYSKEGWKGEEEAHDPPESESWAINLVSTSEIGRKREKLVYRQKLLALANARVLVEKKENEIINDVKARVRLLDKAKELIKIRGEQIHQAKGKLELAQVKFTYGMANNFDLVEAENELSRAQIERLRASVDYIVGAYYLKAAMGGLLEQWEL